MSRSATRRGANALASRAHARNPAMTLDDLRTELDRALGTEPPALTEALALVMDAE